MNSSTRLEHFPISFFAMIMGLSGLTIAWEKAQHVFHLELNTTVLLAPFTAGVFLVFVALYLAKLFRFKAAVIKEIKHPIKINFFPAISISLILLSVAFIQFVPVLSKIFWFLGVSLHLLFTVYVMNVWIHHEHFELHHLNPAWFIPVVGNVLVPITGVGLGYIEISWFFFSIGILFWLILLTIIFNRVLFHNPLPGKLMPTLFILIAPPAVGFISYMKLGGELDAAARILYYCGLFFTLLLLVQIKRFANLQFFLSWWAYSFPMAAITLATMLMYETTGIYGFAILSWVLLVLLSLVVVFLLYKTLKAVNLKMICQPED